MRNLRGCRCALLRDGGADDGRRSRELAPRDGLCMSVREFNMASNGSDDQRCGEFLSACRVARRKRSRRLPERLGSSASRWDNIHQATPEAACNCLRLACTTGCRRGQHSTSTNQSALCISCARRNIVVQIKRKSRQIIREPQNSGRHSGPVNHIVATANPPLRLCSALMAVSVTVWRAAAGQLYRCSSSGTRLLIDAGLSCKEILCHMMPRGVAAALRRCRFSITYEQTDHIGGVYVLAKRLKVPVYITGATYDAYRKFARDSAGNRITVTRQRRSAPAAHSRSATSR